MMNHCILQHGVNNLSVNQRDEIFRVVFLFHVIGTITKESNWEPFEILLDDSTDYYELSSIIN